MADPEITKKVTPKTYAQWDISLNVECPCCQEYFDLARDDDFWVDSSFDVAETDTLETTAVEITCPKCNKEFEVDFIY